MKSFHFPFGLEEEFFLSCAESGALATNAATSLIAKARDEMANSVTSEMLRSQIEIASPVFTHVDEALAVMARLRATLAAVAASQGLRLISAGTHPLGIWHEQRATEEQRYEQLLADFRIIGHRNLVCGLHVHVGVPPSVDRVDVMNRLVRWLPLLLALSTSSPFWNGRPTGLHSYRQALYDEWPRSGIPDFFESDADYSAFADRMIRAGAIRDASQLWWAIRPSSRFPTLELRIADACTSLEEALAIASLFRCLVAAAVRDPSLDRRRTTHTRRVIDENRWRAKRDSIDARFIAEGSSEVQAASCVLERALTLTADEAEDLQCHHALVPLVHILIAGTSAHRQLKVYEESRALGLNQAQAIQQVVRWLEGATLQMPRSQASRLSAEPVPL